MYKNVQTNPEKFQNWTQHSCCSMLTLEIFLKAIRGNEYRFIPKGGTFPTKTITLVVRSSGMWEAYTQTFPKWDKNFTTTCWVPLHDTMPSFMNFRRVLDLPKFKILVSQRFVGNQQCLGVSNSFPFLAWELSMHPRTHIWFFNHFICIGECACSSNLNYAHKMPGKPS